MEADKWDYMDEFMSKKFDKEMLINIRTRNETELTNEYEKEFSLKDIKENYNKYNSIDECRKDIISNIKY
jgi:hypothetical protein